LVPLTRQLGIRIDDLVSPEVRDPRVRRQAIRSEDMVVTPLAPEESPIDIFRITFSPVTGLPPLRTHDGFEWFTVVSGKLRLRLGEQDLVLGRGEAAEFDTRVPHALSAEGGRPATIISIFNSEGARIHVAASAP